MDIASLSVRRPVLSIVMSVIIIIFGLISYKFLGVREFPAIDPPVITVVTNYTGASPEIIQSQITEPLERVINGISGIKSISSASKQGSSVITVEFNLDINLEEAANDVRDKVSRGIRELPQNIDAPPVVSKSDVNGSAIISMTLKSSKRSIYEVSDYMENVIAQDFQTILGVSNIQIWGQRKYSMRIRLDPKKLAAYQLTPIDVRNAINSENVELPSGKISGDATDLNVNTSGRISSINDFESLIIKENGKNIVRLKDVANIEIGAEYEEANLRESGVVMIGIGLLPLPGANYIDIADEFYKRYYNLKKTLPEDYEINIALDSTVFIKKSLTEVKETLLIAICLVIFIIFLFFRDWLVAFRPLIDIPVSLIGAFFIMYIFGYTINVLTLLAIVLATGLVVDDGIVVTENIFKKIEKGMAPDKAAIEGTREIFFAVISTSITLAMVFLPVIFLEGFVGRLFREFGIVLAGSVLISAFVSLTLTPMLNAKLTRKDPHKKSSFYNATEKYFVAIDNGFNKNLKAFLNKKYWALVILAVSFFSIYFFSKQLKSELSPLEDRNWLRILFTGPEGTSYNLTDKFLIKLADFVVDSVPEKNVILTVIAPGFVGSGAANSGFGRIALKDASERKRSQDEIANYILNHFKNYPQGKLFLIQEPTISSSGGVTRGFPIQYVLQFNDFEKIREKLPLFLNEVSKSKIFQGFDTDLKFNKPELKIEINREKAKFLGVSILDIAYTIQLAFSGQRYGYYLLGDKQYSIIGQVNLTNRDNPADLYTLFVRNDKGVMIQLNNLISITEVINPPQLNHYNRFQSATISAGLASGKTIGEGLEEMDRIAKEILDDNFKTTLSGASRDFVESSSNIMFAFFLALILIYLVLAAQFESFIDPLIILLTVPTALAGAFFALWYFNQTINIFSQIGMIMLVGLVTKNGILIIEFTRQLIEKGYSRKEALILGTTSRLRPILMTSLATILGALPIAIAFGAGAKSRMGMGIVIIGGLFFSMILTLFVIPAIYLYFSKIKRNA